MPESFFFLSMLTMAYVAWKTFEKYYEFNKNMIINDIPTNNFLTNIIFHQITIFILKKNGSKVDTLELMAIYY